MARGINGAARSGNPILILSAAWTETYKKQIQSALPRILAMEHLWSVKSNFRESVRHWTSSSPYIKRRPLEQKTSQHWVDRRIRQVLENLLEGDTNSILHGTLIFPHFITLGGRNRTRPRSGHAEFLSRLYQRRSY